MESKLENSEISEISDDIKVQSYAITYGKKLKCNI